MDVKRPGHKKIFCILSDTLVETPGIALYHMVSYVIQLHCTVLHAIALLASGFGCWLRLLASVVGFSCWLRLLASGCVSQDAYILHHRNNRHYDYCNITHGRPTTDGRLLSGPWLGLVSLARRYRMIRSITAQSTTKVRLIKFLEYKISPHPLLFLLDFCY